jgi:hypothetical protein
VGGIAGAHLVALEDVVLELDRAPQPVHIENPSPLSAAVCVGAFVKVAIRVRHDAVPVGQPRRVHLPTICGVGAVVALESPPALDLYDARRGGKGRENMPQK